MTTELSLIPAPELAPNGLPAVLNELLLDDGSAFGHYNVTHLVNSPNNRKRFNEATLRELSASVREKGVAQPILIRPLPVAEVGIQRYEIIAGERRWRASVMAELKHIPALCRKLSDQEADELQILENLQREDPHPLEEAEGYERMMLSHGYSADQLAERLKKSKAYIYGRLKLCALSLDVREPFLSNEISASTALLIARIPVPALQKRALQEILKPQWGGEPLSYRAAAAHIASRYTLKLEDAPFDKKDAKLLAAAGNCVKCPKRTGNQPEIYPDAKSADVCTDPDCFAEKKAAHYQRIIFIANKKGIPVLDDDEADDILSNTWSREGELVTADQHLSTFDRVAPATGMSGTVGKYLTAADLPTPAKYIKAGDGSVEPTYRRADIQAALEKIGACESASVHEARLAEEAANPEGAAPLTAQQEAGLRRVAEQQEKEARAKAMTQQRVTLYRQVRARAAGGLTLSMLRELAKALVLEDNWYSLPDDLLGDLYSFEDRSDEGLCAYIDQADANAIQLLIMDLIVGESLGVGVYGLDDEPGFGYVAVQAMAEQASDTSAESAMAAIPSPEAAPAARKTLSIQKKAAADREAPAQEGPVVTVKKTRIVPAAAWPFPTPAHQQQ